MRQRESKEYGCKGVTLWILAVMKLFFILTVVMMIKFTSDKVPKN